MKVKMKVNVSGPRHDGHEWPRIGGEIDVPDWEGADLCGSGLAEPVKVDKVETATPPKAEERTEDDKPKRGRPAGSKNRPKPDEAVSDGD